MPGGALAAPKTLITVSTRAGGERRPGSVGPPLPGMQTRLVAEDGAPVAHDGETIGSLQVLTPTGSTAASTARTPPRRRSRPTLVPHRRRRRHRSRWHAPHRRTGVGGHDQVRRLPGGCREIETVLLGHPGVAGWRGGPADRDLGQRIVAFVVGEAVPDELIDYVYNNFRCASDPGKCGGGVAAPQTPWARCSEGTDVASLRFTEICVDARDTAALARWWSQALGWTLEPAEDDGEWLLRPPRQGPDWLFLPVPESKSVKNCVHFDFTPPDQQAEVDRLIGPGAESRRHRAGRAELGGARRS